MDRKPMTEELKTYESPKIIDHGDLTALTAAGFPAGHFDADYSQGQPIPQGGPGSHP